MTTVYTHLNGHTLIERQREADHSSIGYSSAPLDPHLSPYSTSSTYMYIVVGRARIGLGVDLCMFGVS